MTKSEYVKSTGELRKKYQKGINDLYIWSSLAVDSLQLALKDKEFISAKDFLVPSKVPDKTVKSEDIGHPSLRSVCKA